MLHSFTKSEIWPSCIVAGLQRSSFLETRVGGNAQQGAVWAHPPTLIFGLTDFIAVAVAFLKRRAISVKVRARQEMRLQAVLLCSPQRHVARVHAQLRAVSPGQAAQPVTSTTDLSDVRLSAVARQNQSC